MVLLLMRRSRSSVEEAVVQNPLKLLNAHFEGRQKAAKLLLAGKLVGILGSLRGRLLLVEEVVVQGLLKLVNSHLERQYIVAELLAQNPV